MRVSSADEGIGDGPGPCPRWFLKKYYKINQGKAWWLIDLLAASLRFLRSEAEPPPSSNPIK